MSIGYLEPLVYKKKIILKHQEKEINLSSVEMKM